ncbi:unnamed protein product [Heligmosomoides polygyrus]|uniref:Uncharacterized protein n=1 Tax=Heligmosomoides polygyrus TaxID=6339 RepID=A0A183FLN7_HELPZ|nr:unnamed protein product [Heligmosomoides polygyrus]
MLDQQPTSSGPDWVHVVVVDDSSRTGLVPCAILLPGGLAVTCRRVLLIDDSSEVCSSSTKRESESAVKKTLANVGKASSFVLPCSLIRKSLLCHVCRMRIRLSDCLSSLSITFGAHPTAAHCSPFNAARSSKIYLRLPCTAEVHRSIAIGVCCIASG